MIIPDNQEIYVYGSCLGQQQQQQHYLPQFDLGHNLDSGMFTRIANIDRTRADPYVATTLTGAGNQNAWHLPRHYREPWTTPVSQQEDLFYQTMGSQSTTFTTPQRQVINIPSTPLTPLSPYSDNSDSQEALTRMIIRQPRNNLTSDYSTSIEDLLAATTSQETISCSIVVLNGTKYYRCACGHLTQRKGDMRRHHESSKHAFRQHFCVICGSGFTRKDGLKRHKKKKHPQHKTAGSVSQTS